MPIINYADWPTKHVGRLNVRAFNENRARLLKKAGMLAGLYATKAAGCGGGYLLGKGILEHLTKFDSPSVVELYAIEDVARRSAKLLNFMVTNMTRTAGRTLKVGKDIIHGVGHHMTGPGLSGMRKRMLWKSPGVPNANLKWHPTINNTFGAVGSVGRFVREHPVASVVAPVGIAAWMHHRKHHRKEPRPSMNINMSQAQGQDQDQEMWRRWGGY